MFLIEAESHQFPLLPLAPHSYPLLNHSHFAPILKLMTCFSLFILLHMDLHTHFHTCRQTDGQRYTHIHLCVYMIND